MEIQLSYGKAVGLKNGADRSGITMNQWISLMDYAMKKGVSLSTLRRHIKSNKIPFKLENGRYLLLDAPVMNAPAIDVAALNPPTAPAGAYQQPVSPPVSLANPAIENAQLTIEQLSLELKMAREEIVELKTLIALYEESMPKQRFDV
jgi:hypothetical protein